MIISEQKPFEEILDVLKGSKKVFLSGCAVCSALAKVGGEPEILELKERLQSAGKLVTGYVVIDPSCNLQRVKLDLKKHINELNDSDSILSIACGDGVQVVAKASEQLLSEEIPVYSGTNTLFIGEVERVGYFNETCSACGSCVLNYTGGICPVTRCPKGLLNGPCGGAKNGMCEVNPKEECVWVSIYKRLSRLKQLERMEEILPPKDYSKVIKPRHINVRKR